MITKLYLVSVDIPSEVHSQFNGTRDYEQALTEAIAGNVDNSYCYYSEVTQTAEFTTLTNAEVCQAKLLRVIKEFSDKLKNNSCNL